MPIGFHHRLIAKSRRGNAKKLRRAATNAEMTMWRLLRGRRLVQFKFRRQAPVENFILDFVCFDPKIAIEIDGSQHFDSQKDRQRDAVLTREGFLVLRYWNNDVLQRPAAILEDIFNHLISRRG